MKLFLSLLFAVSLIACSKTKKPEDDLRQRVEALIKPVLNDPNSYEFVSIALTDSVSDQDNLKRYTADERHDTEFDFDPAETKIAKAQVKVLDSLMVAYQSREPKTVSYRYNFIFRGKNGFGATVLNTYEIQTDTSAERKVLKVVTKQGERLRYPGEFAEYEALRQRFNP